MVGYKNIDKKAKLELRDQLTYQQGQVVSKTLVQNDAVSVTLFAFEKDEEISTHESGGDAMVTVLEGTGRFTIEGDVFTFMRVRRSSCLQRNRMQYTEKSALRCFLLLYSSRLIMNDRTDSIDIIRVRK